MGKITHIVRALVKRTDNCLIRFPVFTEKKWLKSNVYIEMKFMTTFLNPITNAKKDTQMWLIEQT